MPTTVKPALQLVQLVWVGVNILGGQPREQLCHPTQHLLAYWTAVRGVTIP